MLNSFIKIVHLVSVLLTGKTGNIRVEKWKPIFSLVQLESMHIGKYGIVGRMSD